jgi:hypothetical protein
MSLILEILSKVYPAFLIGAFVLPMPQILGPLVSDGQRVGSKRYAEAKQRRRPWPDVRVGRGLQRRIAYCRLLVSQNELMFSTPLAELSKLNAVLVGRIVRDLQFHSSTEKRNEVPLVKVEE